MSPMSVSNPAPQCVRLPRWYSVSVPSLMWPLRAVDRTPVVIAVHEATALGGRRGSDRKKRGVRPLLERRRHEQ